MPEETTTIFCMEGKKHKKRILSILMALCMALCLVPTTAFAEGGVTLTGSGAAVSAVGLRRRHAR